MLIDWKSHAIFKIDNISEHSIEENIFISRDKESKKIKIFSSSKIESKSITIFPVLSLLLSLTRPHPRPLSLPLFCRVDFKSLISIQDNFFSWNFLTLKSVISQFSCHAEVMKY